MKLLSFRNTEKDKVIKAANRLHEYYEEQRIWERTSWLGMPMWKLPFDAMVIQELIFRIEPNIIIETGTGRGGSALFYASLMELMGIVGRVITIDVTERVNPFMLCQAASCIWSNYVKPIMGSSTDKKVIDQVSTLIADKSRVLVLLDSWHSYDHVLKELSIYAPMVSEGSYIIVEDTHVSGHPIEWAWGKGPFEAVQTFLVENKNFELDKECEKHIMTFNPCGYLKRIK